MAFINLILDVPSLNIRGKKLAVASDHPVHEVFQQVVAQLPEETRTASYDHHLILLATGKEKTLDPDRTWEAQGVKDGSHLAFMFEQQAGGFREDRLCNEWNKIQKAFMLHPKISVEVLQGQAFPVKYGVTYSLNAYNATSLNGAPPPTGNEHKIIINVDPTTYPDKAPDITMAPGYKTFHPNISSNGSICVGQYGRGDGWNETLWIYKSVIIYVGRMLSYQLYNLNDSFNTEAKQFVKNYESRGVFPLDRTDLNEHVPHDLRF